MIGVAAVEDDARYRASLDLALRLSGKYLLKASFPDGESLLQGIAAEDPHLASCELLLVDLDLPGRSGLEVIREVRRRELDVVIVVLTAFDDPPRILDALQNGAAGFLLKRATGSELCAYLDQAHAGGAPLTPGVARSVVDLLRRPEVQVKEPLPHLSPRERDVLQALVDGLSYKQIADRLDISTQTVRGYVRTLYRKLGVHSATEAVGKALRMGWMR